MKKTQKDLILSFISEHGSIIPAHQANKFYGDGHFGSEIARECRKLRYHPEKNPKGILDSCPEGGYEKFYRLVSEPREELMFNGMEIVRDVKGAYPKVAIINGQPYSIFAPKKEKKEVKEIKGNLFS
jgi:hypothetical protein